MAGADTTAKKQIGKPFQKGASGNPAGRPKGTRNKLSEDFIQALASDFEANGPDTIAKLRAKNPAAYVKVIADIVPKQFDMGEDTQNTFAALWTELAKQRGSE